MKPATAEPNFTNLQKVLFPSGFTKAQVIDYYRQVAPYMLPHLKGRAVTLKRYPNGTAAPFFFEKHCPDHRPDWVKTTVVPGKNGSVEYCLINTLNSLLWVANLAALELHVLLSHAKNPNRPTAMVFDLDPGSPATMIDCVKLALKVRDALSHLGLQCFAKTSGGKGIHIYVPLNSPVTFDQTKHFSRAFADILVRQNPEHLTTTMAKSERPGKIFIDWSQNDDHKTTACVYTLRAKDRPMASTPLKWEEIEAAGGSRKKNLFEFEAGDVLRRVADEGDVFEAVTKLKQRLPKFSDE